MKESNKELRKSARAEYDEESRLVSGYACLFESESTDLGFTEIISRDAFSGVLEKSDVLALINHDYGRGCLARSKFMKGSLRLSVDGIGLKYEFEAPNTALGDELIESLKRGDITESSFAFTVEDEEWTKQTDGNRLRRINKFKRLYDVSPVYYPAYEGTFVGVRSAEDVLSEVREKEEEEEKILIEKAEEDKREAERIKGYINELNNYYQP